MQGNAIWNLILFTSFFVQIVDLVMYSLHCSIFCDFLYQGVYLRVPRRRRRAAEFLTPPPPPPTKINRRAAVSLTPPRKKLFICVIKSATFFYLLFPHLPADVTLLSKLWCMQLRTVFSFIVHLYNYGGDLAAST
jgi:hypothetical protein